MTHLRDPNRFTGSKGGSRPMLNPEMADSLVAAVSGKRVFDSHIAIAHGIHPLTLRNWLKWGLLPDAQEPYKSFAERYVKEQIEEEAKAVELIVLAAKKDWKAAAWYLEKKFSGRWGDKTPASGPSEAIDVTQLLSEATDQKQSLKDMFADPPPELAAAMTDSAEDIKNFLDKIPKKLEST